MELGVTIPDMGVEVPEDRMEGAVLPFAIPFDIPLAALPTAAGFLDQGDGAAAAGCVFGPPSAGNADSDCVSSAGLLEAGGCGLSRAGCLPAALADIGGSAAGVATREASVLIGRDAAPEGGGCSVYSSSTASSTVGWCPDSFSACCLIRRSAADMPSVAVLLPFAAGSVAISRI